MTWWLEAGEDGSDRIDLMAGGYLVLANGFDIVEDQEYPDQYQQLFIPLSIQGTSHNDLFNKRRAILTKLRQAEQGRQPAAGAPWVNIAIQFGDADTLVRWYIVSGSLTRGSLNALPSTTLGAMEEPALLQLRVLKGGLGEAIEYGPFTVAGNDLTFHIDGIPGDEPALAEFRITDNSTGVVVNRIRWACRSLPDMADGDYAAVLPFNETDESVADTFTGGIETISASSTWQTIGSVSKAATAYNGGLFDAWARVRDASVLTHAPLFADAVGTEGIGIVQMSTSTTNVSSTSQDAQWPAATTAGNLLALIVSVRGAGGTISAPVGWTSAVATGTNPQTAVFYKTNAPSESGGVTVTLSSGVSSSNWSVHLLEIRGVAESSPVDVTSAATNSSTTSGSTGTTSATSQAYALALAVFTTAASVPSTPSSYTSVSNVVGRNIAYRILTATGTQSAASSTGASTNWRNALVVFKGATAAVPTLPADSYQVRVTAFFGSAESAPSPVITATLDNAGSLYVTWDEVSGATGYRVYIRPGIDSWEYYDTNSTNTSFTITNTSSDGTADPPSDFAGTLGAFRVRLGPESGNTHDLVSGPLYATVANSEWEPLYLGRTYLGPAETPLIATSTGWKLDVQGRADTSTQMDVDALVLMPADEQQMDVRYAPGDLDTNRTWVVGTTPDMRSYGFLRDGSANEVGRLLAVGRALMGPGDTTCVVIPTVSGGIWNVSDVELSITVFIRPRYSWLAGGA